MNSLVHGGTASLEKRPRAGALSSDRLRAINGAACAGLSALISGAVAVVATHPGLVSNTDAAVVYIILGAWILYWVGAEWLRGSRR